MNDRLVETHPRDALLVQRLINLEVEKAEKRKNKLRAAYFKYNFELDWFARKFMADENVSLEPRQREELAKIYASRCWNWVGLSSGFWSGWFASAVASAIHDSNMFLFTTLLISLAISVTHLICIKDKIDFLLTGRTLKSASAEEIKNLEKKQDAGWARPHIV